MNNAEYENLISKAGTLPFEVQRPNKDAELASYRKAELLPEAPIKLSTWEQITLKVDATLQAMKFTAAMTPHIISIIWSYLMGNPQKLAATAVAFILALLAHFGIVVPEQLAGVLNVIVSFLVGWLFFNKPGQNTQANQESN
jgi:hypothetical protein